VSVLDAGYAVSAIAVFSVVVSQISRMFSWISMCSRTGWTSVVDVDNGCTG